MFIEKIINFSFIINVFIKNVELEDDVGLANDSSARYIRAFFRLLVKKGAITKILDNMEDSHIRRIIKDKNRGVGPSLASELLEIYSKDNFLKNMESINEDAKVNIILEFEKMNIFMTIDNYALVIANLIEDLLNKSLEGIKFITIYSPTYFDVNGECNSKVCNNCRIMDGDDNYIYYLLQEKKNYLSKFVPDDKQPYNMALKEIEEEQQKDSSNLSSANFKRLYKTANENYAETSWLYHTSRDTLASSADKQFDRLEEEIYDGIIDEYYSPNYSSGLERLLSVTKQSTIIDLNYESYETLSPFISLGIRKGFCHKFVNDGKIKSWVKLDE